MDYLHGGDIYRNKIEYDFSVNVNPLGVPFACKENIEKLIPILERYPDPYGEELCKAIAVQKNVCPQQILLGNGAAELIYTLCYTLRPKKVLMVAPTFQEYEKAVYAVGGEIQYCTLKEENNFSLDDEFIQEIKEDVDLIFLCNPNNPVGNLVPHSMMKKIVEVCEKKKVFLCLDECFLPFLEEEAEQTMISLLEKYQRLIVLRAFTKIYAMPGVRLGIALSSNLSLLEKMREHTQPWNTSGIAQQLGIFALKDSDYLLNTKKYIQKERAFLVEELQKGLVEKIYPGIANYLFFKAREDLKEVLLQEKILIRSCSNYQNLREGYFRIAVRTREENEELIRRWRKQICQKQS